MYCLLVCPQNVDEPCDYNVMMMTVMMSSGVAIVEWDVIMSVWSQ